MNLSISNSAPRIYAQPAKASQLTESTAESLASSVESFVSGAAGAVVGAAVLGSSSLISSVRYYPKHAAELIQETRDKWTGDAASVMQAAIVPVVMFNMLVSPVATAVIGLGLGAFQGAMDGSERGLGAAWQSTTKLVGTTDQHIRDTKWTDTSDN